MCSSKPFVNLALSVMFTYAQHLLRYLITESQALSCGTISWHRSDVVLEAARSDDWTASSQPHTWLVSDHWHHLMWCLRHGAAVTVGSQVSSITSLVLCQNIILWAQLVKKQKVDENQISVCHRPTSDASIVYITESQSRWLAQSERHRREPKPKPITLNTEFNVCLVGAVKCSLHFQFPHCYPKRGYRTRVALTSCNGISKTFVCSTSAVAIWNSILSTVYTASESFCLVSRVFRKAVARGEKQILQLSTKQHEALNLPWGEQTLMMPVIYWIIHYTRETRTYRGAAQYTQGTFSSCTFAVGKNTFLTHSQE